MSWSIKLHLYCSLLVPLNTLHLWKHPSHESFNVLGNARQQFSVWSDLPVHKVCICNYVWIDLFYNGVSCCALSLLLHPLHCPAGPISSCPPSFNHMHLKLFAFFSQGIILLKCTVHIVCVLLSKFCVAADFSLSLSDAGHSTHHTPVPSKCEGGAAALPVWAPQAGRAYTASRVGPAAFGASKIRPAGSRKSPNFPHGPGHARTWTEGHSARSGATWEKVKHLI